jgi:hypothetical protein
MASAKMKRSLEYTPHLITYIDMLGFGDLVKERSPNFISRAIRRVIEATAPDEATRKENKENYVKFSDLIVHTVPIFSAANKKFRNGIVFQEIHGLASAQASLIGEGLLLRGALTIGMLERTYGVLFGPGLISAYDLEREQAQFPRIIVGSELIEALKTTPLLAAHPYEEEIGYISKFVKRDDDDVIFIDYLGGMAEEAAEPEHWLEFLEIHRRFVEENIVKFEKKKRVLLKYLWLKKYHNAIIRSRLKSDFHRELLVNGPATAADVPIPSAILPLGVRDASSDDNSD